jgi:hypothetical protein
MAMTTEVLSELNKLFDNAINAGHVERAGGIKDCIEAVEFVAEKLDEQASASRLPSCEACGQKATHIAMLDSVQYECFCDEHKPDGASPLEDERP